MGPIRLAVMAPIYAAERRARQMVALPHSYSSAIRHAFAGSTALGDLAALADVEGGRRGGIDCSRELHVEVIALGLT
jgi:hypothetical protein